MGLLHRRNMAAAAAAAAVPDWVMVESFVFRRDDAASFREDNRTSAASVTSTGAPFRVSFLLAEPPTPSRLYISFPEGPEHGVACYLLAAHCNLVLFRVDCIIPRPGEVGPPSPFNRTLQDYFVYTPGSCHMRAFDHPGVGLLCHGAEEFTVAYLIVLTCPETSVFDAQLWLLRSSVQSPGGEEWEVKEVPIHYDANDDEQCDDLFWWTTNEAVPFKNSLCWACYGRGVLICDNLHGDIPKVSYLPFPKKTFRCNAPYQGRMELYRSLCVTGGGQQLELADVARADVKAVGPMAPSTGFTLTTWRLANNENGGLQWVHSRTISSDEFWGQNNPEQLPHEVMMLPLLSMDEPNVLHTVLYDWAPDVPKFSLVTIGLEGRKALTPVVPYIRGVEDLSGDDADMVRAKPYFFMHFLATEFPKFLHVDR
ncbi:hypothetical protein ACP4OV_022310 [Aristida adscensionis]